MMYSEFLTLSDLTENYIPYTEYTNEIEPIYTGCELSKADFINLLKKSFEMIVYPAVNRKIENLSKREKELMAFCFENSEAYGAKEKVSKVDRAARKAAYEDIKVYSQL